MNVDDDINYDASPILHSTFTSLDDENVDGFQTVKSAKERRKMHFR